MNFLLIHPDELQPDGRAVLRGRRAEHVSEVLRAQVGQQLRAGVIDGAIGTAVIEELADDELHVQLSLQGAPTGLPDTLLLAVPRPKVLLRMLAHAAALGFQRIVLFRTWRVDKSWLDSNAMKPDVQREQLLLGLEQAGRTALPSIDFYDRFKPMVEDVLPEIGLPAQRFVAHPSAPFATSQLTSPSAGSAFALAIGPDGGFLPYEVERLRETGFCPISCGSHALRTETALAVLTGQLQLLRDRHTS